MEQTKNSIPFQDVENTSFYNVVIPRAWTYNPNEWSNIINKAL